MALILGIDPGSITTGYGLVEETPSQGKLRCVAFGIFEAPAKASFAQRLLSIGQGLGEILAIHKPDAISLEKTFFAKNVDSVTKLSHARGVILYEIAKAKIPVFEYSPTEIKSSVAGHGRADKQQVQLMIQVLLGLQTNGEMFRKFDMSDALALAIHHLRIATTAEKMRRREVQTSPLGGNK